MKLFMIFIKQSNYLLTGAKVFLIFIVVFMVWFTSSLYSDVYRNILEKNFPNRVPSQVQSREEVEIIGEALKIVFIYSQKDSRIFCVMIFQLSI